MKYAREFGYELTAEDLSGETPDAVKLDPEELDMLSGGSTCVCVIGGGGKATREGQHVCVCVASGIGETEYPCDFKGQGHGHAIRCVCAAGGGGKDKDAGDYFEEDYGRPIRPKE